jgi:hypothetical protein
VSALIASVVAIGRQVAAEYRSDSMQIRRMVKVSDGAGGSIPTPSIIGTVGCVLTAGATRPDERAEADRAGVTTPYVIRNIPHNTDIKASDEALIGGRTFRIVGVLKAESVNVAITAVAEERT